MKITLDEILPIEGSTCLRGRAIIGSEDPDMPLLIITLEIPSGGDGTLSELRQEFQSFAAQALREDVLQARWKAHARPLPAILPE